METQTEFSEIEPSFNPINLLCVSSGVISTTDAVVTFNVGDKEILRIERNGDVIAPDLESASAAGKLFVQAIREQLNFKL